jgi:hypothetical protein
MTVDQTNDVAHVWFINATDRFALDIYVGDEVDPTLTGASPLEIGPCFEVQGQTERPFGTYSFRIREEDAPGAAVLASATLELQPGRSYSAAFHYDDGATGYALSVYENLRAASANARLEVRHVGKPPAIDWRLQPRDATGRPGAADTRSGALKRTQCQQATEVAPNQYLLEALVDGQMVAYQPDLQLEQDKMLVAYCIGTPAPTSMRTQELRKYWVSQDFRVDAGPLGEATVTAPAGPMDTAGGGGRDANGSGGIAFECPQVETFAANAAEAQIAARDPAGTVTAIELLEVQPAADTIRIASGRAQPAPEPGGRATATLEVGADTPAATYTVRVGAWTAGAEAPAECTLEVWIKPITLDRICARIAGFRVAGEMDPAFARELTGLLDAAEADFKAGALAVAEATVGDLLQRVEGGAGAIAAPAAKSLAREVRALQASLHRA